MLLKDMATEVVIRSGQFILDPSTIEFAISTDPTKFKFLVQSALRKYNKHRPDDATFNKTFNTFSYTFTTGADGRVPDWISDVIPIYLTGGLGYIYQQALWGTKWNNTEAREKRSFIKRYEKPTLYTMFGGTFEIHAVYNYVITQDTSQNDQVVNLGDSGKDDLFFDLLTGMFLSSIGMFRGSFAIPDARVTVNWDMVKGEGEKLVKEVEEKFANGHSKFYLAMA